MKNHLAIPPGISLSLSLSLSLTFWNESPLGGGFLGVFLLLFTRQIVSFKLPRRVLSIERLRPYSAIVSSTVFVRIAWGRHPYLVVRNSSPPPYLSFSFQNKKKGEKKEEEEKKYEANG